MKKGSVSYALAGLALLAAVGTLSLAGCSKKNVAEKGATIESGVFKIALECAYAPYNWTQTDDSNDAVPIAGTNTFANGYDVLVAKKIADALGCKLEVYQTKWTAIPTSIISGKVDAGICGMTVTEERKQTLLFTAPYYDSKYVAVVKADGKYKDAQSVADLAGAACTSQQSTSWYPLLDQIPGATIQPALADVPTMLVALTSGKCDLLTCDKPTALAAANAYPELKVLDFAEGKGFAAGPEQTLVCGALAKDNTALKEKIDPVLATITDADRESMMDWAIQHQPAM